jgi:hypothetical protein
VLLLTAVLANESSSTATGTPHGFATPYRAIIASQTYMPPSNYFSRIRVQQLLLTRQTEVVILMYARHGCAQLYHLRHISGATD